MLTRSSSSPTVVQPEHEKDAAYPTTLPPSPPLAGAATGRNTRSATRSKQQLPLHPGSPRAGGPAEHATLINEPSPPFGETHHHHSSTYNPNSLSSHNNNGASGVLNDFGGLIGVHDASPSFDGGVPFDLAQYVHDHTKSPTIIPFDLNNYINPSASFGNVDALNTSDMQSRALSFNATLESPLDFDLDYSPFAGSSSEFTPSPWEAPHGTPQLDYSSLFDTTSAPNTGSLDAVFPELSIHPHSLGGAAPLFAASPATRQLDLGPVVTAVALAEEDQATPHASQAPVVEQEPEEPMEPEQDDDDDDEEYQPGDDPLAKASPSSTRTRKRRASSSSTANGPRDPTTGKRVFHGVRTHATVPIVPLDAPVQARKYRGESRTSRKVLPKAIAKTIPAQRRRNVSVGIAEGDEEAKEIDEATREEVDLKRTANTLAARKSRMRKAEYLKGLEDRVKQQEEELEELRAENEQLRRQVGGGRH